MHVLGKSDVNSVPRAGLAQSVIQEHYGNVWLMPPNTKQYAIKSDWFAHAKWERFLLLRIKKASRYWDSLWLDIVQEVKELLVIVEDDAYLMRKQIRVLYGAANPAVVLVVGFEVRLFEWDAASTTLTETNPGHVYSVMK